MKILIISSACIIDVNRAPYINLSNYKNVDLTLLIPYRENEVKSHSGISDYSFYNFNVIISRLIGSHPRLERIKNLNQIINDIKPDNIILEFDVATLMTYEAIRFSKKYKTKVSFIALENFKRNYFKESYSFLLKLEFRKSFGAIITLILLKLNRKHIHKIFCVSNDGISAMLYQKFSLAKLVKMPLGINTEIFFPYEKNKIIEKREELGLEHVTIGYFGRIIPEKGLDILIEALSKIIDLKWQLLLDNFSQYKSEYLNILSSMIEENNLQNRIVYFDAKHHEMPDYINCVDIVVLPSIQNNKFKEQYGRVVAESICCGKIVLVSNTGALPELVEDAGFVFNNKNELVSILRNLIINNTKILNANFDKIIERGKQKLSSTNQANIIYKSIK